MQTFIPHFSCFSNVCERQSPLRNVFRETCCPWFRNCNWLLLFCKFEIWKGKFVLGVWLRFFCPFIEVHCLFCAFVLILAALHLHQTPFAYTLLHFPLWEKCRISLHFPLLIHTPFLLHDCTYLMLFFIFAFIYEFSFLIMILIACIIYLNRFILDVYIWL